MDTLAKANRFQAFGTASLISVIVAGYMALAGTAFLSLNEQRPSANPSVGETANAGPSMVCDCHYENTSECAAN
jgi:hypothetical protein